MPAITMHAEGTCGICDRRRRREEGVDRDGYDRDGYDEEGYNRDGYNEEGYNRDGYDENGYDRDGYDENGCNEEGYDRDGYDCDGEDAYGNHRYDCECPSCREGVRSDNLHGYSYVPRLIFRGERAPFYGMEIEVTTDQTNDVADMVAARASDLLWCKQDASVEGVEIVTHPMSYEWAMSNFPWSLLPEIRRECDATIVPSDNGIHVHVSRDGFDNPAHLYRWLKLWYRNPNDIQRIARRSAQHWASFRPSQREAQKHHVKYGRPSYDAAEDDTRGNRYAAINTTNRETLEVRVFASTLRPNRARAALQLVAGSVEYTRGISAEQVTKRHAWEWPAFMSWTAKDGRYPDLVAENRIRR